MNQNEKLVNALLQKSANCEKSEDAIRFSQAALNCSHTMQVLALDPLAKKSE